MKHSAGLILYKKEQNNYKVLLVHPGGPYFQRKDDGWWSIPKGGIEEGEDDFATAIRELKEETGVDILGFYKNDENNLSKLQDAAIDLGEITQLNRKTVKAWGIEANVPDDFNFFSLPVTINAFGKKFTFPENDRIEWFDLEIGKTKVSKRQRKLVERLAEKLNY